MAKRRTTPSASSARYWRPKGSGPRCGFSFDGKDCQRKGPHRCEPRADKVVAFFAELLVHTKGPWARHAFEPDDWQEHDILRPVFGEVVWSKEWERYVRRYQVAYIVLARKNGKSALAAGIALYLLIGDDEESSEVYGGAKTTKQAGKVWEPAWRMAQLSPDLRKRLNINKHERRIFDERTASYYEIATRDDLGELGHNPHAFILDEVISQPDDKLWNALRDAAGTRTQPLFLVITTETSDPYSFGAEVIDEAERVQEDPKRAPHIFSYVRKTPTDVDPWDERNWYHANPALGRFKSLEAMRQLALEAQNDPTKENSFRQFQLNQRQQQVTRWMPMPRWDANVGEVCPRPDWILPKLEGRECYGGLDLSAKFDLTALTWFFPSETDDEPHWAWWRLWAPEEVIPHLDEHTGGKASVWVKEGWLTPTEGNVIDYEAIYDAIEEDADRFAVRSLVYDEWSGEPVRQEVETRTGIEMLPARNRYEDASEAMHELDLMTQAGDLAHGGNPAVRWQADAVEARKKRDEPDLIKPVKPDRQKTGKRIDGMVTLILAIRGWLRGGEAGSVYDERGIL